MRLPEDIRRRFRAYGRRGGCTRAARMSPEARRAVARKAAMRRWILARFGARHFDSLGLPGGGMIDDGLTALAGGEESVASLLVSLAAPRLRREGIPVPRNVIADADTRLFRLLERQNEILAHARYLAHLRLIESFANACSRVRMNGGSQARSPIGS